jgi:hypothetical protein
MAAMILRMLKADAPNELVIMASVLPIAAASNILADDDVSGLQLFPLQVFLSLFQVPKRNAS